MTINNRIKQIRQCTGLNMIGFGEKIGLTKSSVHRMEQDGFNIPRKSIQLVCTTFHVNEEWLVNGTGEMYTSAEEDIMNQLRNLYNLSPVQEAFCKQYLQLPDNAKEAVTKYFLDTAVLMQRAADEEKRKAAEKAQNSRPEGISDEEWELIKGMRLEKDSPASAASSSTATSATAPAAPGSMYKEG